MQRPIATNPSEPFRPFRLTYDFDGVVFFPRVSADAGASAALDEFARHGRGDGGRAGFDTQFLVDAP